MDSSEQIQGAARRMTGCLLVLFLMWFLGALLSPRYHGNKAPELAVTKIELQNIAAALSKYLTTSNSIPDGDSVAMLRALIGSNRTGTMFLSPRKTNASGEMLDSWNTPYQIEIADQANLLIRSAGPNRRFGDKDDIVFNHTRQQ